MSVITSARIFIQYENDLFSLYKNSIQYNKREVDVPLRSSVTINGMACVLGIVYMRTLRQHRYSEKHLTIYYSIPVHQTDTGARCEMYDLQHWKL